MTDNRTNIKIASEVHERHNERRNELGLSWTEYMRRVEYDRDNDSAGDSTPVVPVEDIRDELDTDAPDFDAVQDALARIEDAAATAEERTGKIERQLEQMGAGR